jgi:nicotinamidase-related amidase
MTENLSATQIRRTSDYLGRITPDNAAMLLIDYQTQLMLGCQSQDADTLKQNTIAMARLAKIFDLPTVLTTTGGGSEGPAGPTLPELVEMFPEKDIVDRQLYFDSMADPEFRTAVEATGRDKLIIGGITTDLCVVFPALAAVKQGYDVYVVADACASWNEEIDRNAIERIRQGGAIVTNIQSLAAELQNNLAMQDENAAHETQRDLLGFYNDFVGPTRLMNDLFFGDQNQDIEGI